MEVEKLPQNENGSFKKSFLKLSFIKGTGIFPKDDDKACLGM
ncbi:hypothetical protein [Lysinibacillus fusiformis]|nr:hypothetical protein [Lysinibacillus fusiformis]UXJ70834.1 hypothetical protein N5069_09935 [Lysinibacillus fusiformis]